MHNLYRILVKMFSTWKEIWGLPLEQETWRMKT